MRMTLKRSEPAGACLCSELVGSRTSALPAAPLTVDFVFVTSSKAAGANNYGLIDVFEVNSESGRMKHIPTSPFPSGGRNPVAEATSPDSTTLYVVNEDDNSHTVQFAIGNDGKVYPQNTSNTPGIFPIAASVWRQNSCTVANTFQQLPSCSPAEPCSAAISVFPIGTGNALGVRSHECEHQRQLLAALSTLQSNRHSDAHGDHNRRIRRLRVCDSGRLHRERLDMSSGFAVNADGTLTPSNGGAPFKALGRTRRESLRLLAGGVVYGNPIRPATASSHSPPMPESSRRSAALASFPTGNGPGAVVVDSSGNHVFKESQVRSIRT